MGILSISEDYSSILIKILYLWIKMDVELVIEKKVSPIVRNVHASKMWHILQLTVYAYRKVYNGLDEVILTAEGYYNHVQGLESEKAKTLKGKVKYSIDQLIELQESESFKDFFTKKEFTEKYNYALKVLYKLHAMLHKVSVKDNPKYSMGEDYINQVTGLSQNAVAQILIKKDAL